MKLVGARYMNLARRPDKSTYTKAMLTGMDCPLEQIHRIDAHDGSQYENTDTLCDAAVADGFEFFEKLSDCWMSKGDIATLWTWCKSLRLIAGVHIDNINTTLLQEFSDFTEKVLGVSEETPVRFQEAKVYRAGVTNAADRGLDMWANFGVAIQIKHISLTPDKVEDITSGISADRIIVVCKECEREILVSVLKRFGSAHRLQSVVTEEELETWYETALRGESAAFIGDKVLQKLANEIKVEFPSTTPEFDDFFKARGYDLLSSTDLWEI